ncbi:malonyl-coenzyme A:anthocyanin 3-O-glucoside-6''-O-malonyltransferase-like protein [Tanacetum coccineum]
MASLPVLNVLEQSRISPPPATVGERSLPLNFFDFLWLRSPPVHNLFFFEIEITKTQFIETIVPNLKHSLSITLQHFYPFVGNLIAFSTHEKPEILFVEGDFVKVTFAESNLDFNELIVNHPRECAKFYHLIPLLGEPDITPGYIKIPVFSVQVTFFPNCGISIGMTNHHTLGDASTRFCFMKAWTSIARSGTDESFLANGTLPLYDRVGKNPKLDESYLKFARYETLREDYENQTLSGPTDKLRATFIFTRSVINQLKNTVSTQLPTLAYVSSFTVACAYIWSCMAKARNDELQLFGFTIDCRARMDPQVPPAYFGNCVGGCIAVTKTTVLTGKEGFVTAAKLLGESLHKTLTDKDGIVKDIGSYSNLFPEGMPTRMIGVAGTPKLKFYDMDFGWGKPKKLETISIDYSGAISMNSCKESNEDLEIGVCLSTTEMEVFVRNFEDGLKAYI